MTEEPKGKIHINITYEKQSVTFATKREKPLLKVFNAFSERLNIDASSSLFSSLGRHLLRIALTTDVLRFFLNERRIRPEETPAELEMEDGDEIDAVLMQVKSTLVVC
ncbi:hypothetical protein NLJ89_g5149 [Agrocybe chaxingu]|uniref:Rad60/SUMO-like domain-containing protein n=1 Tax=Agrocybe chaxingu TaxID=84603 RepID=A0A9W8K1U2_9AGAR|nr:hypothetical protein NLJ89_g5149 [Agrocybe chaxingu]